MGGKLDQFVWIRPGGEIGRRKGLKILWRATSVWVQVPPRAPVALSTDLLEPRCAGHHAASGSIQLYDECSRAVVSSHQSKRLGVRNAGHRWEVHHAGAIGIYRICAGEGGAERSWRLAVIIT